MKTLNNLKELVLNQPQQIYYTYILSHLGILLSQEVKTVLQNQLKKALNSGSKLLMRMTTSKLTYFLFPTKEMNQSSVERMYFIMEENYSSISSIFFPPISSRNLSVTFASNWGSIDSILIKKPLSENLKKFLLLKRLW